MAAYQNEQCAAACERHSLSCRGSEGAPMQVHRPGKQQHAQVGSGVSGGGASKTQWTLPLGWRLLNTCRVMWLLFGRKLHCEAGYMFEEVHPVADADWIYLSVNISSVRCDSNTWHVGDRAKRSRG